jgi:hypothetical protein
MTALEVIPASQALVVITGTAPREASPRRISRPDSLFLAQMIAAEAGSLQYRTRRREIPAVAVAAYAAAGRLGQTELSIAA